MVKGVKDFILNGRARFVFLFSLVALFVLKSVNAVVYLGQSYSGWGLMGYGFNDLQSFYYAYPGWIDFVVLFALFYSAALGIFGEKFKENNAGKGLAVALGLILSLSVALFEAAQGIYMWQWGAPIVIGALLFAIFFGTYHLARKMRFGGLTAFLFAAVVTYLIWLGIVTWTGMGQWTFINFTFGNLDLGGWLTWVLMAVAAVVIFSLLVSMFSGRKWGRDPSPSLDDPMDDGREYRWPRWMKPWRLLRRKKKKEGDPEKPGAKKPEGEKKPGATKLGAGDPEWKTKQVDPSRIRRLEKLLNRCVYLRKSVARLVDQLIAAVYKLNKELKDKEQSLNLTAWGIAGKLDKILKDLAYFKRTLLADHTTLDGLAALVNYFKAILVELNKVLSNIRKVPHDPYRSRVKNINQVSVRIWDMLVGLTKLIRVIKSSSIEYLGKGVGNLNINQFIKIINTWKKQPGPEVKRERGPAEEPHPSWNPQPKTPAGRTALEEKDIIQWTNKTISSLNSLYAFLYRMNYAFGQARRYAGVKKNVQTLIDADMADASTLRDRMLEMSARLGNNADDPLTPKGVYGYLKEVAEQLANPQLKDETKKDIFRGILSASQNIAGRLDLMLKEKYLLNEITFAYNLGVPGKNALGGKSMEMFVKAAQRYNNFLYSYAERINRAM